MAKNDYAPFEPETQPEFPDPGLIGGPQFGQPEEDWDKNSNGWLSKYGSTVVLPIIAVLVLAGGIYLYTTQKSQETLSPQEDTTSELSENDQTQGNVEIINPAEENKEEASQDVVIAPQPKDTAEPEIEIIVPEPTKQNGTITEKAIKGDGVTHLSRRALKDYLVDNPNKTQGLTNEHKVYIEDYLKDKTGSKPLEVNDEVSFSNDLIQEAINASLTLTEGQLNNLKVYSAAVNWQ